MRKKLRNSSQLSKNRSIKIGKSLILSIVLLRIAPPRRLKKIGLFILESTSTKTLSIEAMMEGMKPVIGDESEVEKYSILFFIDLLKIPCISEKMYRKN